MPNSQGCCEVVLKQWLQPWSVWFSCGWSIILVHQKVVGSVPNWGTNLGFGFGPQVGEYGRQPTDVSLTSMFLSLSLWNQ